MTINQPKKQKIALVTGAAGFIGYHLSRKLLDEGWRVVGLDCISDYYDVSLKMCRNGMLEEFSGYRFVQKKIETPGVLLKLFKEEKPNIVIHLAAQAGVRYSVENPRAYLESNIIGTFELLEAAKKYPPEHLLLASTSSVYGSNTEMPYKETDKADHQMSFYASTKKSTESLAHSYAHLYNLPTTMFRFFTVYGPWGRPDMALFKFTKAILEGEKIDIYNYGNMMRDFTYIDDLIEGVWLLIHAKPRKNDNGVVSCLDKYGSSPVAPFRVVNIGNSRAVQLMDFIKSIENALGKSAKKNLMDIQAGDVPATWADAKLLKKLTKYEPTTDIETGVFKFVEWYRKYFRV